MHVGRYLLGIGSGDMLGFTSFMFVVVRLEYAMPSKYLSGPESGGIRVGVSLREEVLGSLSCSEVSVPFRIPKVENVFIDLHQEIFGFCTSGREGWERVDCRGWHFYKYTLWT